MASKHQVFALHDRFPGWTCRQIADALGCKAEYVHTIKRRYAVPIPAGVRGRRANNPPMVRAAELRRMAEALIRWADEVEHGPAPKGHPAINSPVNNNPGAENHRAETKLPVIINSDNNTGSAEAAPAPADAQAPSDSEDSSSKTFGRITVQVFPSGDVDLLRAGVLGRGATRASRMWDMEQIEVAASMAAQRSGQDAQDELRALRWAMERLRHG